MRKLEFNDLYNPEGLYPHQEFVRRYLSPFTPYKGLLIFHSLGSGKSLICISVAVDHYLHDGKRCLLVTKGSSGRENFRRELDHYYDMAKFSAKNYPDDKGVKIPQREYNRIFVSNHYMALHNSVTVMTDRDVEREFSNMVLVFDEIHNVRKLKIVEVNSGDEANSHVYDSLKRIVKLAKNTKIMLATATPMTNDIGQLNSTISLLSDDDTTYDGIVSYNSEIKDKPQKIFHGVDGYLTGTKVFVSKMRAHQLQYHVEEQRKGTPKDIYRMLTHVSLFAFPEPGLYGRTIYDRGIMVPVKASRDITTVVSKTKKKITYTTYHVVDKYRQYLTGDALRDCGCKYWELMNILENNPTVGPIFVFAEEVKGSGLLLLANIFEAHGYELYVGENLRSIGKGKRFTICVGDQTVVPNQTDRLDGFNHRKNVNGEYVRVLIGSKVVGESITLRNVRQFHVMTIHWNDSTIEQAVGRVVRSGSHSQLDEDDRKVDIFIHAAMSDTAETGGKMGKVVGGNQGTDIYKLRICNDKQQLITEMERKLRRHAVDRYITQGSDKKYQRSSDADTFIKYYMEKYARLLIPQLECNLEQLFKEHDTISMDDILGCVSEEYNKITIDLVCKVILNNVCILGKYLREDLDGFFLTDDASLPFFFVRNRVVDEEEIVKPKYNIPLYKGSVDVNDTPECMEELRDMSFIQRISYVEKYVAKEGVIPRILDALFIKYHGKLYHIMCYRTPGEAYTAVLPIPKRDVLECRMRVLYNTNWDYVEDEELEKKIVAKMETKYEKLMSSIDNREDVFLVISLIDSKPRIRTRFLETTDKGFTDKRYVRKGRSLHSITKPTLAMMFGFVLALHDNTSDITNEMREKYITRDDCAVHYGFSSMKKFAKKHPLAFDTFVVAMEKLSVTQLVTKMVKLMMEKKKCIFL